MSPEQQAAALAAKEKFTVATISVLMQRLGVKEVFIEKDDMDAVSKFVGTNLAALEFDVDGDKNVLTVRLVAQEG
ncbi:MAG: hypothetical protein V4621_07665 [Pseudomonadota bacterium]